MNLGPVLLIALLLVGIVIVLVVLVRREHVNRRLSEYHGSDHADDQTAARAAAQAAHMGRGGGWPSG